MFAAILASHELARHSITQNALRTLEVPRRAPRAWCLRSEICGSYWQFDGCHCQCCGRRGASDRCMAENNVEMRRSRSHRPKRQAEHPCSVATDSRAPLARTKGTGARWGAVDNDQMTSTRYLGERKIIAGSRINSPTVREIVRPVPL